MAHCGQCQAAAKSRPRDTGFQDPCFGTAKGREDPAKLRRMSGTPAMGSVLLAAAGRREAAPSGTMGSSLRRQPHRTSFIRVAARSPHPPAQPHPTPLTPPTPPTPPPGRGSARPWTASSCAGREAAGAAGAACGRAAQRGGAAPAPCARPPSAQPQQGSIAALASADSDLLRLASPPAPHPPPRTRARRQRPVGPVRAGPGRRVAVPAVRRSGWAASSGRGRALRPRRHRQPCHGIYCAIRDRRSSVRRHHCGVSAEGSSRRRHAGSPQSNRGRYSRLHAAEARQPCNVRAAMPRTAHARYRRSAGRPNQGRRPASASAAAGRPGPRRPGGASSCACREATGAAGGRVAGAGAGAGRLDVVPDRGEGLLDVCLRAAPRRLADHAISPCRKLRALSPARGLSPALGLSQGEIHKPGHVVSLSKFNKIRVKGTHLGMY